MKKINIIGLLILLFSLSSTILFSQDSTKIKLHRADVSEYDVEYAKAQRLLGNVMFEHKGAVMYCDSAWLYEEDNLMKAFGKVRIIQGDSIYLNADRLIYHGVSLATQANAC